MRSNDWIFACFALSGILLVWVKSLYPNAFIIIRNFILHRHDKESVEYFESRGGLHTLLLNLNFLLLFSIFIYISKLWATGRDVFDLDYIQHLQLLVGLGVYFTFQLFAHVVLAKLMDNEKASVNFLLKYQMWRFSVGFVLLPLGFLVVFSKYLNTPLILFSLVFIGYLYLRSLFFSLKDLQIKGSGSLLYIIFYICSLEIAPVIWLVK